MGGKVNFVDNNNVVVGYDTGQSCCEDADYILCKEKLNNPYDSEYKKITSAKTKLGKYVFDTKYFEKVNAEGVDEGGMVRFRLTNGKKEIFLHLYNNHNGYYGHGFSAEIDGVNWKQDCL